MRRFIIHLHGRRWRDGNGNTYHTCDIWVDGQHLHKVPYTYGYETQYVQSAREWLKDSGYLPGIQSHNSGGQETLWAYCDREKITLVYEVDDVRRRRDL